MKIALFTFLFEPQIGGGSSVVVNQLIHSLIKRSHSVVVITTWNGNYIKKDYREKLIIYRIPPMNIYWVGEKDKKNNLKKILWQLNDIWNPAIKNSVLRLLSNENVDVVHSHKLRGLSPSIWRASNQAGVKNIIHTSHDFELISPQGLLQGKIGRMAKDQKFPINIYQNIRASASKPVNHFTCPSEFLLKNHNVYNFFPHAIKEIVPNSHGFSFSEIELHKSSQKPFKPEKYLRLLFIGRLVREKGIITLCEAVKEINKITKKTHLDVIGWGPLENELQNKFSGDHFIQFHGPMFGDEKYFYLQNCDVLVVPSEAPESFGIVIIEAFAFGKPVISTNIGAFPELVDDGVNGFLFSSGNKEELINKILLIIDHENILKEISPNCFKSAENYCIEDMVDKYQNIYLS